VNSPDVLRIRPSLVRALRLAAAWLTLVLGAAGCVKTTIRSGRAPGVAPPGWEERWRHGVALGLDELTGPVAPNVLCPNGWSEVDMAIDPVQAAIAMLTLGIYTPTTVSVVCADPGAQSKTSRAGRPTPAPATRQ
jgi:hypothetical protein